MIPSPPGTSEAHRDAAADGEADDDDPGATGWSTAQNAAHRIRS
jgi:hypothetical protein